MKPDGPHAPPAPKPSKVTRERPAKKKKPVPQRDGLGKAAKEISKRFR